MYKRTFWGFIKYVYGCFWFHFPLTFWLHFKGYTSWFVSQAGYCRNPDWASKNEWKNRKLFEQQYKEAIEKYKVNA